MALTKFRLVNVEGIARLVIHEWGTYRLEDIDDKVAWHLYSVGSRYVEKLPDPVTAADTTEPGDRVQSTKKGRNK
jgi:hypothetical protein